MARTPGLYKRPGSRFWWLRYYVCGREVRESSKTALKRDAEAILASRRARVAAGRGEEVLARGSGVSLRGLLDEYERTHRHQRAWMSKRSRAEILVARLGEHRPVSRLGVREVEAYRSDRLTDHVKGNNALKAVAPATVNRELAILRHMVRKGVEWGMVAPVVLERVRAVRNLPEENRRQRFLSHGEIGRLLAACTTGRARSHLWAIVTIALNTGMRRGEILGLTWDCVDLTHHLVRVTAQAAKSKRPRTVPLNDAAMDAIRSLPRALDGRHSLFAHADGSPIRDIKHGWREALVRAGIRDCRFHDLRHTFASHAVMSGTDLVVLRDLLGHADLSMVSRYAHLSPKHGRQAVDSLRLTG